MAKLSKLAGVTVPALWLLVSLPACTGKKADTKPKDMDTSIPKVDPTLCDTNGKNIVTFDLNHDNRPDVWRLYKVEDEGGTKVEFMTCKQVDFDHDGRKDWVVAYDRKGNQIYEKADFDRDGKWDMSTVFDPKTHARAEVERSSDFEGKFDVKEIYDTADSLTAVRLDRNGDGKPDVWEQYKDTVLLAILYDDDFDGKVDRREEIPGARPKIEMPTTLDPTASGTLDKPDLDPGAGSAAPKSPAPKTAPKKK
jgi:hypothetical protein